jgi:hypothetical protein
MRRNKLATQVRGPAEGIQAAQSLRRRDEVVIGGEVCRRIFSVG